MCTVTTVHQVHYKQFKHKKVKIELDKRTGRREGDVDKYINKYMFLALRSLRHHGRVKYRNRYDINSQL